MATELDGSNLPQVGLGIFAKTVQLSPVKTRLAASIGKQRAEQFYHLSLQAIQELACALPSTIDPYWAIAEADGLDYPQWQDLPHFWTGDGGLGMRLYQVYQKLRQSHGFAMLIGTDSPQITPALIEHGQNLLKQNPNSIVIGPCSDGGFYLFAGSVEIPQSYWNAVAYSQSTTLQQLVAVIEPLDIEIQYLPEQQDVDLVEDLSRLQATLTDQPRLLSAQKQLLNWLNRAASAA